MHPPSPSSPRFAEHAAAPWSSIGSSLLGDTAISAEEFADVVSLAVALFRVPIVAVTIGHGREADLVCRHGLGQADVAGNALLQAVGPDLPSLQVADASTDPRFRDDAVVSGAPGVRFFKALAIADGHGQCVCSLAIADTVARNDLDGASEAGLERLGRLVAKLLDRRHLQRRNRIAAQIMQADFSAVVVVDATDAVVFVNRSAELLFGRGARSLRGMPVDALFPLHLQADPTAAADWLQGTSGERSAPFDLRVQSRQGELRTLQATRCSWKLIRGEGSALLLRDMTRQLAQQETLRRAALEDALTGLPNRNGLMDVIDQHLQGGSTALGLALLGLDNFKSVNDTLGHSNGDAALQAVTERLRSLLPAGATMARFGGDEFALIYPGVDATALEHHLQVAFAGERLPYEINGHRIVLEASIGLAYFDPTSEDGAAVESGDLVARADLALYRAKANGGRQFCRYEPGMRLEVDQRRRLDLEIRRAHADNEFELHYQPQIDLGTGTTVGAEALLRWRHPERGLLPPVEFIEALSNSPVAADVGRWILERACLDAASWPTIDGREVAISVNLFPVQVSNGRLQREVEEALSLSGLRPQRLELEITENIALRPDDDTARALGQLRQLGVRLAFDDFGTGYASLSMLQRLQIDRVKIDRSFVCDMLGNHGDAAIVRSILLISRNLELDVIAEGVENIDQADVLRNLGCQGAQGFLYAPALAPQAFDTWLATDNARLVAQLGLLQPPALADVQ